jgi:hypothetical protein
MNKDTIEFNPTTKRVTLKKANGNTFEIASYDNAHVSHRRGALVIGDCVRFKVSEDTKSRILKHFYPEDSLAYLKKHGYIAS